MSFQTFANSDNSIIDLQATINGRLSNSSLGAIDFINIDYGSDKNRIGATFTRDNTSMEYSDSFQVIANTDTNMKDAVTSIVSNIAAGQATTPNLVPTIFSVIYANNKHRAAVAMGPSSLVSLPGNETYSIASFKQNSINDLESVVDTWLKQNDQITVVNSNYYFGNGQNRFWVLYYGTETDATNDQTPSI